MSDSHLIALGLTPYHIANLETLATFLESEDIPPPTFNLISYVDNRQTTLFKLPGGIEISLYGLRYKPFRLVKEVYDTCGTSACAIGHGPLAGIPALEQESWGRYEYRAFGVSKELGGPNHYRAWRFMFGPDWIGSNNTAKGSAARIRYFLRVGVPEGEGWRGYNTLPEPWFDGMERPVPNYLLDKDNPT